MVTVAAAKQKYRAEIWNRVSPINGVPAADILAARNDIPDGGAVYLIYRDDQVIYFQPHAPGQPGLVPMSDAEALRYAEEHVLRLACADIPIEVTAAPNPAAVNATVVVTATLPVDTPDTEVTFELEDAASVTEPVVEGQAVHAYVFLQPGTYQITVRSTHHGAATVEVSVR